MRFIPFILVVGVLLNCLLCVVFKLRIDRRYNDQFVSFRSELSSDVQDFTRRALSTIDDYFLSNQVSRVSSDSSPVLNSSPNDNGSPLLKDIGDWKYTYFEVNGIRYARVSFRNYKEGDFFPRGGVITSIHPDGLVVDGRYWVKNSLIPSSSFSVVSPPVANSISDEQLKKIGVKK